MTSGAVLPASGGLGLDDMESGDRNRRRNPWASGGDREQALLAAVKGTAAHRRRHGARRRRRSGKHGFSLLGLSSSSGLPPPVGESSSGNPYLLQQHRRRSCAYCSVRNIFHSHNTPISFAQSANRSVRCHAGTGYWGPILHPWPEGPPQEEPDKVQAWVLKVLGMASGPGQNCILASYTNGWMDNGPCLTLTHGPSMASICTNPGMVMRSGLYEDSQCGSYQSPNGEEIGQHHFFMSLILANYAWFLQLWKFIVLLNSWDFNLRAHFCYMLSHFENLIVVLSIESLSISKQAS